MHKVGVTYFDFNVKARDLCRVTCDKQGVHKAEINKVQRNMDSKDRIMEGKTELVQSVPTHPVSELFPTSNSPGSKYEGWNFNSGNYLFTTDTK